ncbi:MAG: Gfo/Idh/MocA family oxidoreductase [Ruminococcaceae bacterium]|nr:Gfo/Idh/MocA family oxidoreductase [Oscillospiraceae bacterium]
MKKIVILGCENSHANKFLAKIAEGGEFGDIEVIGIYSDELESAKKLNEQYGAPIMESYDEAVGKVDGVIITARHGANHYKYAKPYIASGVPMFIDKPITITEEEVTLFMRELKENGIRVSGGSSLKHTDEVLLLKSEHENEVGGATISGFAQAPLNVYEEYGGFYFYAQHLVEMILEVYGRFPISVTAKQNGKQIHTIFHYENFDCMGLYSSACSRYHLSRISMESCKSCAYNGLGNSFVREFGEFKNLLDGGEQRMSFEEFASPVFVMNAIKRSIESGKEEPVGRLVL